MSYWPLPRWDHRGGSSWPWGKSPFSRQDRKASRWPPLGKWIGGRCTPSWPTNTMVPPVSPISQTPKSYIRVEFACKGGAWMAYFVGGSVSRQSHQCRQWQQNPSISWSTRNKGKSLWMVWWRMQMEVHRCMWRIPLGWRKGWKKSLTKQTSHFTKQPTSDEKETGWGNIRVHVWILCM